MDAFYQLSPSRQAGMTVGAIPFEAVDAYATRYSIDTPEDFEEFYTLLRAVDSAWLDAVRSDEGGEKDGPRTPEDDTVTRGHRGR